MQRQMQAVLEATAMLLNEDGWQDQIQTVYGGSQPGNKPNQPRYFEGIYQQLYQKYFLENPLYGEDCQRFQMALHPFINISEAVTLSKI